MAEDKWSVTVKLNGDEIVTIGSGFLSGRDLTAKDEEIIRMAANGLLRFVGAGNKEPYDDSSEEFPF